MENKKHDDEIAKIKRQTNLIKMARAQYYKCIRLDLLNRRFPIKHRSMFRDREDYLPLDKWDSTPDP